MNTEQLKIVDAKIEALITVLVKRGMISTEEIQSVLDEILKVK
ncbi:hypothetical protein P9173_13725 [Bacillus safensis]|nr:MULTISPECIES: hypothetical protein [Bacillus]MEC3711223.1 hypothetical protein [Bacillus safensis]MEC3751959.1 hypothetical protein [Bacillus safensis]MED0907094.1 hypothetical protein [Bacillus safensis]